jgi:hypothetical protein
MSNPLAERIDKVLRAPRAYRGSEVVSLGFWMKEQDHDSLVQWLAGLTLRQWRIAWGAGIPGDAYFDAMRLYRALGARIEGVRASDGGEG